jgi:hypothetical protein
MRNDRFSVDDYPKPSAPGYQHMHGEHLNTGGQIALGSHRRWVDERWTYKPRPGQAPEDLDPVLQVANPPTAFTACRTPRV